MSKKAETKTETKKKEFSLADLAKQIKKDYGSIHVAADREDPTEFISTGNKALDLSLSGGIAWGYAVEWSGFSTTGKTTLMQMMLADAQKRYGAYGIWVDRENSWFNKRAEQLGIDTSNVLVIKPWDIPTVTDAAAMLKNTLSKFPKDKYKFVAVDSISSFKKGGKIDKSDMGKKPQELHNLFREILSYCDERMSVHFSNHRTYKIGIMFGCLHADCNIPFVDGRSFTIRQIVDNRIEGEVFAYDENSNEFKPTKIVNWLNNGNVSNKNDFVTIITNAIDTLNGKCGITCTKNHKILTESGWIEAKHITKGDFVVTKYDSILNKSLKEFIIGTSIGDSSIEIRGNGAYIKLENSENKKYNIWKLNKLSKFYKFNEVKTARNTYIFSSTPLNYELKLLKNRIGHRNPTKVKSGFTWLSLAVLFMDDGHYDSKSGHCRGSIAFYRFKNSKILDNIAKMLKDNFNIDTSINYNNGKITINKNSFLYMCENIKQYIPPCMQYKLPIAYREKYREFDLESNLVIKTEYVEVLSVTESSERKFRQTGKYDIEVDKYSNYLAGNTRSGIVVHNSNTTTTGGEGPKFYTTYRVQLEELRNILDPKRNKEDIGNWLKATVLKTRMGDGRRKVYFPHYFKTGIPYYGGYARLLADRNYLYPKNKKEFKSLSQVTVKHEITEKDVEKREFIEFSEHDIEKFLEDHPELVFDEYPEFNYDGLSIEEDEEG